MGCCVRLSLVLRVPDSVTELVGLAVGLAENVAELDGERDVLAVPVLDLSAV